MDIKVIDVIKDVAYLLEDQTMIDQIEEVQAAQQAGIIKIIEGYKERLDEYVRCLNLGLPKLCRKEFIFRRLQNIVSDNNAVIKTSQFASPPIEILRIRNHVGEVKFKLIPEGVQVSVPGVSYALEYKYSIAGKKYSANDDIFLPIGLDPLTMAYFLAGEVSLRRGNTEDAERFFKTYEELISTYNISRRRYLNNRLII